MRLAVLAVTLALLAGCTQADPAAPQNTEPTATVAGHVFDAALRPVAGASVVLGGSATQTFTDSDGYFEFITPGSQPAYALRVTAAGFLARSVVLQSNDPSPVFDEEIILDRLPSTLAYHQTMAFEGNIVCSLFAQAEHSHGGPGDPGSHNSVDCSEGTNEEVWEFSLTPGVRNVVIEMHWTPNTPLSERLAIFVEAPGMDNGEDVLLYFNEGPSGVRATIGLLQTSTYYQETGGEVRVTVKIGAPEEDVAVGVAVNQSFEVFATAFYILPGPNTFSVNDP